MMSWTTYDAKRVEHELRVTDVPRRSQTGHSLPQGSAHAVSRQRVAALATAASMVVSALVAVVLV